MIENQMRCFYLAFVQMYQVLMGNLGSFGQFFRESGGEDLLVEVENPYTQKDLMGFASATMAIQESGALKNLPSSISTLRMAKTTPP